MASLNDKIIAYLTVNNITFSFDDYETGQPEGEPDQILHWDAKLGAHPTQEQLDSSYGTYQANIVAAEQAKIDLKTSAHAKLAALGLTPEEISFLI